MIAVPAQQPLKLCARVGGPEQGQFPPVVRVKARTQVGQVIQHLLAHSRPVRRLGVEILLGHRPDARLQADRRALGLFFALLGAQGIDDGLGEPHDRDELLLLQKAEGLAADVSVPYELGIASLVRRGQRGCVGI